MYVSKIFPNLISKISRGDSCTISPPQKLEAKYGSVWYSRNMIGLENFSLCNFFSFITFHDHNVHSNMKMKGNLTDSLDSLDSLKVCDITHNKEFNGYTYFWAGVRLCINLTVTTFPGGVQYFYLTGLINSDYMSGDWRLSLILQGKTVCPQRNTIYSLYALALLLCPYTLYSLISRQAPNFHYFKSHSMYLSNLIIRCCLIRKANSVYSISNPKYRLDNKEKRANRKYTISVTSYAKDYKELLSLDCDPILFDILLFIDLLTRIMSFFLSPTYSQSSTAPADRLIPCRQKGHYLWSGRIKMLALTKKCRPPKLRVHAVQAVLPGCPIRLIYSIITSNNLNKLPNQERLEDDIREAELTDTESLRPDANVFELEQRRITFSTEYVEMKLGKSRSDTLKTHEDLLRLVNFCKDTLDKKDVKSMIAVQEVGYYVTIYLFSLEATGLNLLTELYSFNVPKSISELPQFVMRFDEIKIMLIFEQNDHDPEKLYVFLERAMLLSNPASERAGINIRTAQGWVKRMDDDPEWDIYGKFMNKANRGESQLHEEHKYSLIHLFNEQPQVTRTNVVYILTAKCEDFSLKESQQITCRPVAKDSVKTTHQEEMVGREISQTDMDYLSNVFFNEVAFDIKIKTFDGKICKRNFSHVYYTIDSCSISHHSRDNLCHGCSEYQDYAYLCSYRN
ncbi:hypothetical protein PHYBLDRAFT_171432 [Phycomyces blakesleeanus NRRL 1555(-)]|uniref:Uncharacterized protein n=1 Tax=Phycomyces blakesleeanus (strain ATCC 8743b / DSM 1359 / FGSC 10004 / NBRC 33097 / NRRL 1555) TaxID=763407 RepID=A0A167LL47_PHYB8|nr:hypothetical protein PHYBLDRAFT_171432 [Phycomyces blakesleeanus NRRL 1555(-)]OAD70686.1 hypothetical protein PHYBLDRAFT_171432 [Phycomyces blakesleeanus NRRL 1555(-)]|eukprot:XP_018288726.1 hypothetical protein PHYBLDRAFT_171432 [Phycomyces blakesleeanus NRRL 1555(-)]